MGIIDRVKNILLAPKSEWAKIAEEAATTQSIFVGYVCILAAIGPVAMILRHGALLVTAAIGSYVISLAITFVLALIVDALAPTFGGEKNFTQSLKLTAYTWTVVWVAGIFQLLPVLGGVIGLLAVIYAVYTCYLGVPVVKKCPADKAVVYTIVIVLCGFGLGIVLGAVLLPMMIGGSMMGAMGGFG